MKDRGAAEKAEFSRRLELPVDNAEGWLAIPALRQRDFSRVIGDGAEDLQRRREESGVSVNEASERKPDEDGRMMWPCDQTKDKLKGAQKERNVGKLETRRLRGHFKRLGSRILFPRAPMSRTLGS